MLYQYVHRNDTFWGNELLVSAIYFLCKWRATAVRYISLLFIRFSGLPELNENLAKIIFPLVGFHHTDAGEIIAAFDILAMFVTGNPTVGYFSRGIVKAVIYADILRNIGVGEIVAKLKRTIRETTVTDFPFCRHLLTLSATLRGDAGVDSQCG